MGTGNGLTKRFLSLLLTGVMALTLVPSNALTAYAEEAEPEIISEVDTAASAYETEEPIDTPNIDEPELPLATLEETYIPDTSELPDDTELFAGYAWQALYGNNDVMTLADYGKTVLTGNNLTIYNRLRSEIAKVASGSQSSAVFKIDTANMGITYRNGTFSGVDTRKILDCLLVDCPYELYWYDKTASGGMRTTTSYYSDTGSVVSLTFSFSVVQAYAGSAKYTTNTAKTGAAARAASTAQSVVRSYSGRSDYDKLIAYKNYICNAVSYNYDASGSTYSGGYGDPWQLIYVFDNNSSTNVVCEGYSKAFQYLCDLSNFSSRTTCYTVTGSMSGGAHMWNIVSVGGKSYLADITNSDSGSIGQNGGLFLVGNKTGSWASSYTFAIGSQSVSFAYDSSTKSLYGSSILTLSSENIKSSDFSNAGTALTGLKQEKNGVWYYYKDGRIDTSRTGLVQDSAGTWFYVKNGVLDLSYTGLIKDFGTWFYIENGAVNWEYTGLVKDFGTWFYVENGTINWNYSGLVEQFGTWFYVDKGILNWKFTGLVKQFGTWFYVENSVLDWGYTGLVKDFGTWFYVDKNVLNWQFTGLAQYNGTWFYVKRSVLDWNYTGYVKFNGKTYKVVNGVRQ